MGLNDEKNFKYRPINVLAYILGILLGIILVLYLLNLRNTRGLVNESRILQKQKDSLLQRVKMSQPKIEVDSLVVVELRKSIKSKDSLLDILNKSEEYYKNKWYATYKKLKDAQQTYNNSDRRTRDSLAVALAKQKG